MLGTVNRAKICALKKHPVSWETVWWVPSLVSSFRAGRGLILSTVQMVKLRSERSGDLSNASSEGGESCPPELIGKRQGTTLFHSRDTALVHFRPRNGLLKTSIRGALGLGQALC